MTLLPRDTAVHDVCARLQTDGYAIIEGFLDAAHADRIRAELRALLAVTPQGRNAFEGFGTRRLYALFKKTRAFDNAAIDPLVLGVLDQVLGHYQFSAPVAIDIGPGEAAQALHRDDGVYPLPEPHGDVVLNTMWALDDFTAANGATRLVPGSQRWHERRPDATTPTVIAEMPAGSMMFYLGSVWHGGGANTTAQPRLGVILEYVAGWLRPQENHILGVPAEIARTLPERLQELLGYNIYPPFVGYVDGRHPRRLLEGKAAPDVD